MGRTGNEGTFRDAQEPNHSSALMNILNLSHINIASPYTVWNVTEYYYYFKTDFGAVYKVGFMDDYSIWEQGAYQFLIMNETGATSPNDPKLHATILCIIEAFFEANPEILLYICETGDGKQAFRSRLFIRWFKTYNNSNAYVMETAEVKAEGQDNFAALIVQKSNPRVKEIVEEFEETIKILTNKPQ